MSALSIGELAVEPRFGRLAFEIADSRSRSALAAELSEIIGERLRAVEDFHEGCYQVLGELRRLGHDLWSMDEGDEFQQWGPNYRQGVSNGLQLRLVADGAVTVEWVDR